MSEDGQLSPSSAAERIGIFGGTFDPPHMGHLIAAECAADALGLNRVLFVPAADPPHKRDKTILAVRHRLAMVEAAIADNPRFVLSEIDLTRPGPHYSADMVRLLHEAQPNACLFLVIGGDSLVDFPTWNRPAVILRYATLAVIQRPAASVDWPQLVAQVPELDGRVQFIAAPELAITATALRQRARAGQSLRYQVPDAVRAYIEQQQLYR